MESVGLVIALDGFLFIVFVVPIYLVLVRRRVSKQRAGWLAVLWGVFLLEMIGATFMSVTAFMGD